MLVGGEPTRIEADLDRQVVHVIVDGVRIGTLNASSGNGEAYATRTGTTRATTPVGRFIVERRIVGERHAPLGVLYDPLYFFKGWAIHGSNSVPAHEASHGCVRIERFDASWLQDQIADGTEVVVHGGRFTFTPQR